MPAIGTHPRRAITLIELLLFDLILALAVIGGMLGGRILAPHGRAWGTGGAVLGAIIGIASLPLVLFVMGIVWRLLEPSHYNCRCTRPDDPGPESLQPLAAVEQRAVSETRRLSNWDELASLQPPERLTRVVLEERLFRGALTREQIAIAAGLGHPIAGAMQRSPASMAIPWQATNGIAEDIDGALANGVPPRLCLVWAIACVARALSACEREFHQDTRPRQAVGGAVLILRDDDPEAKDRWKSGAARLWWLKGAGCRVARRGLWDRLTGRPTAGQCAAEAAFELLRAVFVYLEPDHLWTSPPRGDIGHAYLTPKTRCDWSQPCLKAKKAAALARKAAADPSAELQWQRDALANLVLDTPRWNGDREQWRACVDECWVPRIRARVKDPGFDLEQYIDRVRNELVPWRARDQGVSGRLPCR